MFFECRCAVCRFEAGPVCASCAGQFRPAPVLGDVRTRFVLDDALRPIVVALKYRRERRLARWVAETMVPLVPTLVDRVTWVPATPERVRWRGYDQSAEIARALAASVGVPATPLLGRERGDERQTSRSRSERLEGPRLASRGTCDGLVVVVDDVITTGATLATATTCLGTAGARRVIPVAFAATPRWDQRPLQRSEHSSTIRSWKSKSAPSASISLLASRST